MDVEKVAWCYRDVAKVELVANGAMRAGCGNLLVAVNLVAMFLK